MIIKRPAILSLKIVILSFLFIFGIATEGWPDSVKSIKNTTNRLTIIKMDKNEVIVQKKKEFTKESTKSSKKRKARFPPVMPSSNDGAIIRTAKMEVNFLKALEEKKKPRLIDSLDKVIYSHKPFQVAERDKFLTFQDVTKTKSSNSDFGQPLLKPYPDGNQYFEEGKIQATLKLLEFKREERFKEIFIGLHFSFYPMSRHMFLDMNATSSSEKGTGFFIPLLNN